MNLSTLEIFLDVMQLGSFADVAKHRNVAPSSISRSINTLEKELGVRLFQRTTRKLSVTEAGQNYYLKISPLISDLKQASESAVDSEQLPQGNLRVTSSVSFGHHILVPLLSEFMGLYPDIRLDFVMTDRSIDIISEKIDVAIRHGTLDDSSLSMSRLIESQYRLVASPEYIKQHGRVDDLESIKSHRLLVFDLPQFRSNWTFLKSGQAPTRIAIHGSCIMSNALSLRALTLQGAGISLLANWLVDDDIKAGKLVHLLPEYKVSIDDYDTSIHLLMPSRSYLPKRTRVFVDFLKSRIGG